MLHLDVLITMSDIRVWGLQQAWAGGVELVLSWKIRSNMETWGIQKSFEILVDFHLDRTHIGAGQLAAASL